jgi:hypothetical protein
MSHVYLMHFVGVFNPKIGVYSSVDKALEAFENMKNNENFIRTYLNVENELGINRMSFDDTSNVTEFKLLLVCWREQAPVVSCNDCAEYYRACYLNRMDRANTCPRVKIIQNAVWTYWKDAS